jgi:hypothetical protein
MNTTEEQVITSEAVAAWMKQQLAKVHESAEYGHIMIEINQDRKYADQCCARFAIYDGQSHIREQETIEKCFDGLSKSTPQTRAKAKREAAEKLLAEADALEGGAA